jgi:hypothetical protein
MLKNLLDPNSEKSLKKALDNLQGSDSEQIQSIVELVIENHEKLADSEILTELSNLELTFRLYEKCESLRDTLGKTLTTLFIDDKQSAALETLFKTLTKENNSQALYIFAKYCANESFSRKALESLEKEQKLSLLADNTSEASKKIIVEDLNATEDLKTLEKSLTSKDKKTLRLVQEKITKLEEDQNKRSSLIEQGNKLISGIEAHAKSAYAPLYESKLLHLKNEWQDFSESLTKENESIEALFNEALDKRFESFKQLCEEKINKHANEEDQKQQKSQDKIFLESALEKLQQFISSDNFDTEACEQLVNSIDSKAQNTETPANFDTERFENYKKLLSFEKTQSTQSEFLKKLEENEDAFKELFESNHKRKKSEQETLKGIELQIQQIKELLEKAPRVEGTESKTQKLYKNKLKTLNTFKSQCLNTQDEFKTKFDKKTGYIKSEIENKALSTVSRLCKEADELIQYCRAEQTEQLNKRMEGYKEELAKLEDWYNFATLPKRKELVEKMQALVEKSSKSKIKTLKEEIKGLQEEWKKLGRARDKEGQVLWENFKTLGDKAYEPVKRLIEQKDEEKQLNLEKRKKLLEELESLINSLEQGKQNDWNQVEKSLKNIQKNWRYAFPLPGGKQSLQKSFEEQLKSIEELLKPQRKVNLGKKKSIVQDAEKLLTLDNNRQAIDGAKKLQDQWKSVGYCDQDQELWEQFRKICDKVFEARNEIQEAQKGKEKQAIEQAQKLCIEIESIPADSIESFKQEFNRICSQFEDIQDLPKKRNDISKQFSKAKKNAQKQLSDLKQKQSALTFEKLDDLCKKIADLEKDALIESKHDKLIEQANSLVDESDISQKIKSGLQESFKALCEANNQESMVEDNKKTMRELCVALEIELNLDSPIDDQAIRMELQVQRLNQKFNANKDDKSINDRVIDVYVVGGLYSYQNESYAKRLQNFQKHA